MPATKTGAWRPHWDALCTLRKDRIRADWTVIGMANRGLDARWRFRQLQTLGWHPFLRSTSGGTYRPSGAARFRPLARAVIAGRPGWRGAVTGFSSTGCQLEWPLLAHGDTGHTDRWRSVTDRAPQAADGAWYGLRPMIEGGFKATKRGGWHWQPTKLTDPARAPRLWLARAGATVWVVSVGGAAAAPPCVSMVAGLPVLGEVAGRPTRRSRPRLISCFRRGVLLMVATLIATDTLPTSALVPEPWPKTLAIFP